MRALRDRDPIEFEYALFSWAFGNAYLAKGMYPEAEAIYRQLADRYPMTCCFFDWLRRWRWKDIARKLALFSNALSANPTAVPTP